MPSSATITQGLDISDHLVILKIIKRLLVLLVLGLSLFIAYNNVGPSKVTPEEVSRSVQQSRDWILHNRDRLYSEHSAVLWWMLAQAVEVSGDESLRGVLQQYLDRNRSLYARSFWYPLLYDQGASVNAAAVILSDIPYYNTFFIYGFSCSPALAEAEVVRAQQHTGYCRNHHPISPACVTHQMMGLRFMQRAGCGDAVKVESAIASLSDDIRYQSIIDFRLLDVYLQRVLMQLDTGNRDKINDRWIYRIIHSQLDDGGWDDFQPLLPVGNKRYLGLTKRAVGVRTEQSDFHATVQGLWIMVMLQQQAAQAESTTPQG